MLKFSNICNLEGVSAELFAVCSVQVSEAFKSYSFSSYEIVCKVTAYTGKSETRSSMSSVWLT